MISTKKIKELYEEVRKQIFNMIPEKWESIYLYASVIQSENRENGEMFFYYFPKGMLRKNPVNVYEIPNKFSIDEESYLLLAKKLYHTIRLLRQEWKNENQRLWSNITITIEELKFKIEYHYDNLVNSNYSSYERHLIFQYKYLDTPLESFHKKEREKVIQYFQEEVDKDCQIYQEPIYEKNNHNNIEFNKENSYLLLNEAKEPKRKEGQEKQEGKRKKKITDNTYQVYSTKHHFLKRQKEKKPKDNYERYKLKQEEKKRKEEQQEQIKEQVEEIYTEIKQEERPKRKSQILNY